MSISDLRSVACAQSTTFQNDNRLGPNSMQATPRAASCQAPSLPVSYSFGTLPRTKLNRSISPSHSSVAALSAANLLGLAGAHPEPPTSLAIDTDATPRVSDDCFHGSYTSMFDEYIQVPTYEPNLHYHYPPSGPLDAIDYERSSAPGSDYSSSSSNSSLSNLFLPEPYISPPRLRAEVFPNPTSTCSSHSSTPSSAPSSPSFKMTGIASVWPPESRANLIFKIPLHDSAEFGPSPFNNSVDGLSGEDSYDITKPSADHIEPRRPGNDFAVGQALVFDRKTLGGWPGLPSDGPHHCATLT
ncbi:hypothetical protein BV22DRAFT_1125599 [Leucogyrophana mollusca]|uniref:Uncharacterized protein n=1 Tax=Leucogyrophana mollusca TaxID=85980 RepID=A0ACB8BXV9_9AGAM|nr:hypothetical protein BV22DRAFT_1125599 [Leucogyrophana mollusca]